MTPQEAEATKPFLKAVVVGTVTAPRLYQEVISLPATIDSPLELYRLTYYVEFKLSEIQVIDGRSGRIVASYKGAREYRNQPTQRSDLEA